MGNWNWGSVGMFIAVGATTAGALKLISWLRGNINVTL